MTTRLGQQLIYAFSNQTQGGNPSYVIASSGTWPQFESECIRIAQERACEVTHIHFDDTSGEAQLRFYVASGAIAFCGHGALAASAWAAAAGRVADSLLLDYGSGRLRTHIRTDGVLGFVEQAGVCRELVLDQGSRAQLAAMLFLPALPQDVRVLLGGRQRAKAMIVLPEQSLLRDLKVVPELRDQFCIQHEVTGIYPMLWRTDKIVRARHFPLRAGENEDMATGNIAATVAEMVGGDALPSITIAQGGADCSVARLQVHKLENGSWLVGGTCRFID